MQAGIPFPSVSPELFSVTLFGVTFALRWYALAYIAGILLGWRLAVMALRRPRLWPHDTPPLTLPQMDDFLTWLILGIILGGRLGFVLFYQPAYYLAHPLEVFAVWQGGMSFHGGLLGVIAAMVWFAYSRRRPFWQVADFVAPCVPTGLAAGRIGNFINGELPGRLADPGLPWGMVFRGAGELPRHPSQIYQFLLEGLLLFVLLWWYARRRRATGRVAAAFLVGYGVLRFIAEFFREPDAHLGLLSLGMSMGQWLCIPMVLAGAALWWWAGRRDAQWPL